MAWIYLVESEDSHSHSQSGSDLLPIVKTTDTLREYCLRECVEETCDLRLSGMTCKLSRLMIFHRSILSTEVSHVRILALQEMEKAWKESEAVYSSRSSGSSARYDLDSSSWRTSQRLLFEEQNELLASFAAYGMTVDGVFYPLQMWERRTVGIGGGSWHIPTPTATDANNKRKSTQQKLGSMHSVSLKDFVTWPTPNARDCTRDTSIKHDRLPDAVNSKKATGQLNPMWVEWLMGYPLGWTELKD